MNKAQLRTIYKAKRNELSATEIERASEQILQRFQDYMDTVSAVYIHVFLPIRQQNEINTWPIINWLWQRYPASTVVTSVADFETGTLTHFALTPHVRLAVNRYGIPEPDPATSFPVAASVINLVLVPLLAFDRQGNRVGYGKGFYDRFLTECHPACYKVGLSLFEPADSIANVRQTDIRLTACITPVSIVHFS